ncbi:hypothetical protein S40288_10232, partial [Stachybotrys chartarum IBT 40288]
QRDCDDNTTLRRVIAAISSDSSPRTRGRPKALLPEEEIAICRYVIFLERSGLPASKDNIISATMAIRCHRTSDTAPEDVFSDNLRKNWYPMFRERHPELRKTTIKALDKERVVFEASNEEHIRQWYERLDHNVKYYNIGPSEIWNEDECGIQIGCLSECFSVVITYTTRSGRPQVTNPANRESWTLLGCANAVGDVIPPWIVLKTYPTSGCEAIQGDNEMRFARSDTGFSNAEITVDWLKAFNQFSWIRSAKAQKERIFPRTVLVEAPNQHPYNERIYRMLVLDGFTGDIDTRCAKYCILFDIIIARFPPHCTHLMQPLDVSVFQPLKAQHQRVIREHLREGHIAFRRLDFLKKFTRIFTAGFKRKNIISGFQKTGLWPPSSHPVLKRLAEKKLARSQRLSNNLTLHLPQEQRFAQASAFVSQLTGSLEQIMSSPTRRELRNVQSLLNEASLMDKDRQKYTDRYQQRIKAYADRARRGTYLRAGGDFITSTSLREIQDHEDRENMKQQTKNRNQQLRQVRSIILKQIASMKSEWRGEKHHDIPVQGGQRKLHWNEWLVYKGKKEEHDNLEKQRIEINKRLKENFLVNPTPSLAVVSSQIERNNANEVVIEVSSDCPLSPIGSNFYGDDEDEDTVLHDFIN